MNGHGVTGSRKLAHQTLLCTVDVFSREGERERLRACNSSINRYCVSFFKKRNGNDLEKIDYWIACMCNSFVV